MIRKYFSIPTPGGTASGRERLVDIIIKSSIPKLREKLLEALQAVLPIAAIVRLSQAPHNRIRRLRPIEAIGALLPSAPPAFSHDERLQDDVCALLSRVIESVPVYHLECLPDADAARLSCQTIFGE